MTNRPAVYAIDGLVPVVHEGAFVHPSAVLIGDVIVGAGCYIGPCACLRGDFGRIEISRNANVQDCCVIHSDPDCDTLVDADATIGHGAILHCCRIERNALIGMRALVMDNALIGRSAVVAAGSVVRRGMQVPPQMLVAGTPARILRKLSAEEIAVNVERGRAYAELTRRSLALMTATPARTRVEPGRRRLATRHRSRPLLEPAG